MARSISQIYAEAVYTRNNYAQLTELNSGRTKSKMSVLNLITYVMAVLIHTYETLLDVYQIEIAQIISNRINGTPQYYATVAKFFQFNPQTQLNDAMHFNNDTLKVEYESIDTTHRIITRSSYERYNENDAIILKVAKDNSGSDNKEGTLYMRLTDAELTAFKNYIAEIKFAGAVIYCVSYPGDIVTISAPSSAPIYYDDTKVSKGQALENIKNAMTKLSESMEFDDYLYYQQIITAICNAEGIVDVGAGVTIDVQKYNEHSGSFETTGMVSQMLSTIAQMHYTAQNQYIGSGALSYDDKVLVEQARIDGRTEQAAIAANLVGQARPLFKDNPNLTGRMRLKSGYISFTGTDGKSTINTDNITLLPNSQRND